MSYKPSSKAPAQVVALPSMSHSLSHLPNMPAVDPSCLHYGALGASKAASQAKLQQTLQRRDTSSTCGGSSSKSSPQYYSTQSRRSTRDDGDYLMMGKGRK